MKILALDAGGLPRKWISFEDAIVAHAKGQVVWSAGNPIVTFRGGHNHSGVQSKIETTSIIAIKGKTKLKTGQVILSNKTLFGRDRHMCAYCGEVKNYNELSRDHIVSKYTGGLDTWMNVVTSCMPCNSDKGHKSLQNAGLKLLYVPYIPNYFESIILANRNILADQMEYLLTGVPKHSRLLS